MATQGRRKSTKGGTWVQESPSSSGKSTSLPWACGVGSAEVEDEAGGLEPACGGPLVPGRSLYLVFICIQEPFRILRWGIHDCVWALGWWLPRQWDMWDGGGVEAQGINGAEATRGLDSRQDTGKEQRWCVQGALGNTIDKTRWMTEWGSKGKENLRRRWPCGFKLEPREGMADDPKRSHGLKGEEKPVHVEWQPHWSLGFSWVMWVLW